jgi:hypothetical protein
MKGPREGVGRFVMAKRDGDGLLSSYTFLMSKNQERAREAFVLKFANKLANIIL